MPDAIAESPKPRPQFWLIAVFLALVFATGGASRSDVQSLLVLYPASAIFCGLALSTLRFEHIIENRLLVGGLSAVIVLALTHLVPMPPQFWKLLGGANDLASVLGQTSVLVGWKPFTPVTSNGWQSALSLTTPMVIVLLGVQLRQIDLFRLLLVVIGLISLSGFIGLLQAIGDPNGSLYFYSITNNGSAVGLFANRNHAATMLGCLFPLLAVYALSTNGSVGLHRSRQLSCALIVVVTIPLILITGSRSGLISAILGLAGGAVLYRTSARDNASKSQAIKKVSIIAQGTGALALIGVVYLTYWSSRAEAIERLFLLASDQNLRAEFVNVSLGLFWSYFPFGIGSGSFAEIYQAVEPNQLLNPTRLNRVHNDWVELAVTFGLPGLLLAVLFTIFYLKHSYRIWRFGDGSRRSIMVARMAGVGILILAIASLSDYPLRTPTTMSVFALFTLWFVTKIRPSKRALNV